jgi:hypothetical protein
MQYVHYTPDSRQEFLVFEPEDWSEDEWKTILKIFGFTEAERIVVRNYSVNAYATPTPWLKDVLSKYGKQGGVKA